MKLLRVSFSILLALFISTWASPSQAQTTSEPFSSAPYRVGERLTYNVSFSNFITAGHVEFLVAARGTFSGREGIQLKGHVETIDPVYAALFAINNDYITYVDPATGLPYYGQQIVRVASRTTDVAAEFNQPAGSAAPPTRTGQFAGVYDFLSAIYRARSLPLADNASYFMSVRGENETFDVELRVKGRQIIKTNIGSFDAIATQVKVRNNSRADNFNTRIYFSDDPRHIPVLITAKHSAGEIRAQIVASELVATPSVPPTNPPGKPETPKAPAPLPNPVGSAVPPDRSLDELPFTVGEQLNYSVFLSTIQSSVAQASFQVRARSKYFNKDGLLYTVSAQTTNALQHLFFASDTINSYVDPKTLLPFQTELNLVEGRRRQNNKLTINQDYGTVTTDKGERIEIPVGTHDYLSFFYMLRTFNLAPPRRSAVSILVNNKPKTLIIT